jgi:3-deoxy-D-manno-octulosonic-acid transferase
LLLVPRHKDRFEAVADLLTRRGFAFARRSAPARMGGDVAVLLGDTLGELTALYASADIAFVGGSLVPVGGHNLLEPAALGLPVLTGPSNSNGKEIAQLLLTRGAALQVNSAAELAEVLKKLIEHPPERKRIGHLGQDIIAANRGCLAKLLELVKVEIS